MARNYVRIESVTDIDTSRIGVGNIDVRYIDTQGRRYATRFNKRSRKVEIVRIALGHEEATEAKQKKITGQEEVIDLPHISKKHPAPWKIPEWLVELDIEPMDIGDLTMYMGTLEREAEKFSERFRGIISNLKNSGAFDDHESDHDFILDLTTHYDHDIQEHLSKAQNLIIEYQRFPKNISHYVGTLDRNQKVYVEKLNSSAQMLYIQALTVGEVMISAMHGGIRLLDMIHKETESVKKDSILGDRKKFYENAMVTLEYVRDNIKEELARILGWMKATEVI
ncbi:MAG: hypothetical protein KDK41_03265 [Leptospiraceae bacterium]|nr:hypothetical protein [Leptospiraceae bacterium]